MKQNVEDIQKALPCEDCDCPAFILPVCVLTPEGEIRKFDSPCLAECAGFNTFLPCESDCGCGGIYDPVCVILDDGSVEQYPSACEAICDGFNVFYNCNIVCDCPSENDPVCVTLADGTTRRFDSPCWAECSGFSDFEACKISNPEPGDDEAFLFSSISLNAFPNPFYDRFTLSGDVKGSGDIQVIIYNLLGQRVLSRSVQVKGLNWTMNLDASNLAAGTYFAQINDGPYDQSIKLIKNN